MQILESLFFYFGFFYCLAYILFPYLYSFFKTPAGFVWTPVPNQHHQNSDNRIYASCVQEARLNFFKYKHPCSPKVGNMAIDFLRVSSYRTAAILGLFIPDERWAFLLSFLFSILLQYTLIFFICFTLMHSHILALLVSFITIFWYELFIFFDRFGLKDSVKYVKENIINSKGTSYFDKVNDNFRYVVMSVSGIYIWLTLCIVLYAPEIHGQQILFLVLFVYFIFIPFVYPSTSLFSIAILMCSFSYNAFLFDEYSDLFLAGSAGVSALIFLICIGLIKRIKDVIHSDLSVLSNSHVSRENYSFNFISLFNFLFKRILFLFPLFLLFILPLFCDKHVPFLYSILSIFIFAKLIGFFLRKNDIVDRLIFRGGIPFLFFSMVCSLLLIIKTLNIPNNYLILIIAVVFFFVAYFPAIGCYRMMFSLQRLGMFYMPKDEWEMYRFIKNNTLPRSNVLAFSFSNLQLLPVFTHSNLYVRGAEWLENPDQELKKYIRCLSFIGKKESLIPKFEKYFEDAELAVSSFGFKIDEKSLKDYHLINTLIYVYYAKTISGIEMTHENEKSWSVEFVKYLNELVGSSGSTLPTNEIDYILIDKEDFPLIKDAIDLFEEIHSNERYTLFYRSI